MTIKGVKNQFNHDKTLVDEMDNSNINKSKLVINKIKKISKLIKDLKKY